jgi:hypothetical protein
MKMNQNMRRFLEQLQTDESVLSAELSSVLEAGFVEGKGCVLLASLASDSAFARAAAEDETGYECFINHLHIENLGEAPEFARRLNKALVESFEDSFVVIVSFDGREATVRFHRLRADQTWFKRESRRVPRGRNRGFRFKLTRQFVAVASIIIVERFV